MGCGRRRSAWARVRRAVPGAGGRYHLEIGLGNLAAYQLVKGDAARAADTARQALVIADEIGDRTGVLIALETLALALAEFGVAETAAWLHGHIEAAHRELGLVRQETERSIHDQLSSSLAAALAPQTLARLSTEGAALDARAAIAYALGAASSATSLEFASFASPRELTANGGASTQRAMSL